jgi:hypothetical protein
MTDGIGSFNLEHILDTGRGTMAQPHNPCAAVVALFEANRRNNPAFELFLTLVGYRPGREVRPLTFTEAVLLGKALVAYTDNPTEVQDFVRRIMCATVTTTTTVCRTLATRFNNWAEWAVEPGDPSVGIFGESVWHDDCPNWNDDKWQSADNCALATASWFQGDGGNRKGFWVDTYKCPECGQVAYRFDWSYEPEYDEDDYRGYIMVLSDDYRGGETETCG